LFCQRARAVADVERLLDHRMDVDAVPVRQRRAAYRTVPQVLQRLPRIGTRRLRIRRIGCAWSQGVEVQATDALQPVGDRVLLDCRAAQRHLDERNDGHQCSPLDTRSADARSTACLALAILEVTTAARSTSDRKIWMRAMSRLAPGMSTCSNRLTRWVMRRTP